MYIFKTPCGVHFDFHPQSIPLLPLKPAAPIQSSDVFDDFDIVLKRQCSLHGSRESVSVWKLFSTRIGQSEQGQIVTGINSGTSNRPLSSSGSCMPSLLLRTCLHQPSISCM